MTTARAIVTKAMQKIGALTKTETPSADEINDGLDSLNAMLSSWSNDSMLVYARTWESFNITSGIGEYTVGPGQDFNTVRPIKIVAASLRWSGTDNPLSIIPDEIYETFIQEKSQTGLPRFLNCDNAFPTAKIRLWPIPSDAYGLRVLTEKQLAQFDLDDVVELPPGWGHALIHNLAVEMGIEYPEIQPSPLLVKTASDSKKAIKRAIMRARSMDAQPSMPVSSSDIYSGY